MRRRTNFGPDMGNSGWTPIDDDLGYPLKVRPEGMSDLTSPWSDESLNNIAQAGDDVDDSMRSMNLSRREKNAWLDYISSKESARDGYNAILRDGKYGKPNRNISEMTLNEVLNYQKKVLLPNARRNGENSSAVGRYQIVSDTLGSELPPFSTGHVSLLRKAQACA